MSLYHDYRPKTLDEVFGNKDIVSVLKSDLKKADPPRVLLFHGPTGCGKTTMARIAANMLGCNGRDLSEVDASSYRGIDTVRDLQDKTKYSPLDGKKRVWILDECHQMTKAAQNGLLKALEDTPPHVAFILCTTDPQNLLPTIRGRCAQYQVAPLAGKEAAELLDKITHAEGEEPLDDRVLDYIIGDDSRPRDMIQRLERVLSVDEEDRLSIAKRLSEDGQAEVLDLCRALIKGENWKVVREILSDLKTSGEEVEKVRRKILGYCGAILLKGSNDRAFQVGDIMSAPMYSGFSELIVACYSLSKR